MKNKTISKSKVIFYYILALIFGIVAGVSTYILTYSPASDTLYTFASGDLSIHFMELGNQYAGDSIYIKANDIDILIDAGSRQNSATSIINYVDNYCTDNTLEYVIATHAHQDHISAFVSTSSRKGVYEYYTVKNIIDFGDATKYVRNGASATNVYTSYVSARTQEIANGAKYAKASDFNTTDFLNNLDGGTGNVIDLGSGITLTVLYNYYYDHSTSNENNYSVCVLLNQGSTNVLLTGDLESEGESYLVANNTLPECDLFKAAHHGSYTGSTDTLLSVIKPKNVVFTCVAGSSEYTKNDENMFPSQIAINNVAKHTKNCFVTSLCTSTKPDYSKYTSMNGNVVFVSNSGGYKIVCQNNDTLLKDTSWFKANRTTPTYWQ